MSVAEIKEQLCRMTPADRKEIARHLLELSQEDAPLQPAADFAGAKSYVFDHYGELLKRLAQ